MTADLSALIARLEAAEAGDQDLSLEVNIALEGGEPVGKMANYVMEPYWAIRRPNPAYVVGFENGPNYPVTTSLDAALALAERVFPDGRWMVERTYQGTGWAMFQPGEFAKIRAMVDAATPALALCIAALRAKLDGGESRKESP